MYTVYNMGKGDILFNHDVKHYFAMCITIDLYFLPTLWYIWFLQLIVNEMVYLIVGGIPKACHVELYDK